MNENKSKNIPQVILAPLTGKAVPLSEVPDSVFSEKVLGDGVAIIPEDCKPGRRRDINSGRNAVSIMNGPGSAPRPAMENTMKEWRCSVRNQSHGYSSF